MPVLYHRWAFGRQIECQAAQTPPAGPEGAGSEREGSVATPRWPALPAHAPATWLASCVVQAAQRSNAMRVYVMHFRSSAAFTSAFDSVMDAGA